MTNRDKSLGMSRYFACWYDSDPAPVFSDQIRAADWSLRAIKAFNRFCRYWERPRLETPIKTISQLCDTTEEDWLNQGNVGFATVAEIRNVLKTMGRSLRDS